MNLTNYSLTLDLLKDKSDIDIIREFCNSTLNSYSSLFIKIFLILLILEFLTVIVNNIKQLNIFEEHMNAINNMFNIMLRIVLFIAGVYFIVIRDSLGTSTIEVLKIVGTVSFILFIIYFAIYVLWPILKEAHIGK